VSLLSKVSFFSSSTQIVCVGFSRSTGAGLRSGLHVRDFHCPVLFFSTAGVVFLLISVLCPSLMQRKLDARCHQQLLGQAFPCGDFSCPVPTREPAHRQVLARHFVVPPFRALLVKLVLVSKLDPCCFMCGSRFS
jgi:hypothetical protein